MTLTSRVDARTAGWHRPLLAFTALSVLLTIVTATALFLDTRQLDGMPIWAKPLKFALSFTLYGFTWAWLYSRQRRTRRWGWWLGTVTSATAMLELIIIVTQAARGRRSHFNVATPLDTALWQIMGLTILVLFTANLAWAILVLRDQPSDTADTWSLRLGITLSLTGMALGGLMTFPTDAQVADPAASIMGAHSVGVADGGPGLPLLGWSTVGGDLRIPHFVGMHALQLLPLLALGLMTLSTALPVLRDERVRARLVQIAGGGYTGLLALVTWQALRGQPLIKPDALTVGAATVLAALVLGAAAVTVARAPRPNGPGTPGTPAGAAPADPTFATAGRTAGDRTGDAFASNAGETHRGAAR